MAPKGKVLNVREGDEILTDPYGPAVIMAVINGGNTYIIAYELDDRAVYTLITGESVIQKLQLPARLLRVKNASFAMDMLAVQQKEMR